MRYICNDCNKFYDDEDLECICGSKDLEELDTCNICEGEYRMSDLSEEGVCYNCYTETY